MAEDLTRRLKIYINGTEVDATITNLRKNLAKFRAQVNQSVEGTPKWKKYNEEVARTELELKQAYKAQKDFKDATVLSDKGLSNMQKNLKGTNTLFGSFKKTLGDIFFPVSGAILFTDALKSGVRWAKEFVNDAIQISIEAKGVEFAFKRLGDVGEDAFLRVKASTRGLLSDLEIKKSLVEFDNFNISLEESATLFEFLTIRSTQTGQSIDYLKQSMVEGLSKESKLRIDNLGISTAALNEELKKTPNFVQAVANIAKTEIARAGNILDEAASSSQRFNATLENAKLKIGNLITGSGAISWFQNLGSSILESLTPADSLTKQFENQQQSFLKLQATLPGLIDEYETLKSKSSLSADEQERLKTVITQIGEITPGAITQFDDYGNAMDISTTKAKDFIATQQALLKFQNKEALEEQTKALQEYSNELKIAQKALNFQTTRGTSKKDQLNEGAIEENINRLSAKVADLQNKKADAERVIDQLSGDYLTKEIERQRKQTQIELEELQKRATAAGIAIENKTAAELKAALDKKTAPETAAEKAAREKAEAEKQKAIDDALAKKQGVADAIKKFDEEQKITEELLKLEEEQRAEEEEVLRLEAKYQKLTIDAKGETTLLTQLEEQKAIELQTIRDKYAQEREAKEKEERDKLLALEKKYRQESIQAEINLQNAKANAREVGISTLRNLFGQETAIGKALFAFEKARAISEIIQSTAAANAKIVSGLAVANTLALAYGPFVAPGIIATNTAVAGTNKAANNINAAVQIATIAAGAIKGSFAQGGETFSGSYSGGVDGIGGQPAIVHPNEYIIPAYVRKDPEVPRIIDYLEAKRTGTPTSSSDTAAMPSNNNTDAVIIALTNAVNKLVDEGVKASTVYTLNDEKKRRELADKLDNTIKASKK